MATTKTKPEASAVDYSTMNVYQKLQAARLKFLQAGVRKTGKNMHLEFTYFELADIVPAAETIFSEVGLLGVTSFYGEEAVMHVFNVHDPEEKPIGFSAPFTKIQPIITNSGKQATNEMQALGSSITYMRRYLWQLALDIIEADSIDPMIGAVSDTATVTTTTKKASAPATKAERAEIKKALTTTPTLVPASEEQIDSLKRVLGELLTLDPDREEFVQKVAMETNAFSKLDGTSCDQLISHVRAMIDSYKGA